MGGSELLRYGYITNGLADHTLEQGIDLLAEAGYQGIGITLDHHHLDPFQVTDSRLLRYDRPVQTTVESQDD